MTVLSWNFISDRTHSFHRDEYTRQTQSKHGCYNMEFMKNVAKRLFYLGILLVTGLVVSS